MSIAQDINTNNSFATKHLSSIYFVKYSVPSILDSGMQVTM